MNQKWDVAAKKASANVGCVIRCALQDKGGAVPLCGSEQIWTTMISSGCHIVQKEVFNERMRRGKQDGEGSGGKVW